MKLGRSKCLPRLVRWETHLLYCDGLGSGCRPWSETKTVLRMPEMDYGRNRRARRHFDGIASGYERLSQLLSFFQLRLLRRFLVSRLWARPGELVLDLCTGTAGVAAQIAGTFEVRVVGVDLSPEMLRHARRTVSSRRLDGSVALVMG